MLEIQRNFLSPKGQSRGHSLCEAILLLPSGEAVESSYMPPAESHRAFQALLHAHSCSGSLPLIYSLLGNLKKMMLRVQRAPRLNTLRAKAA